MSDLYLQALTHSSWACENDGAHNERLEFIGDAVLQLAASEVLFLAFPDASEGHLSDMRKQVVSNQFLASHAQAMGVGAVLRLGVGEERTGGRSRPRNLAGAYEALLGAMFLDPTQGYGAVRAVVAALIAPQLEALPQRLNEKQVLHEWVQETFKTVPRYKMIQEEGPDHSKRFTMEVHVNDMVLGQGEGTSKSRATQAAASAGLRQLRASGML